MPMLTILRFPDPRLRTVAKPVEQIDANLQDQIDAMFETMYQAPGIGLAATQVDFHQRLLVLDVSEDKTRPMVLINPEIIASDGFQTYEEGCLSVPGVFAEVKRANKIRVRALDRNGKAIEFDADGLEAVCIQHEIDHLDGKVFVDYLSPLKRAMVKKKIAKQMRLDDDSEQ